MLFPPVVKSKLLGVNQLEGESLFKFFIERLAHAERNAVSAAYNFAEHLPERRKMMQAWADYLDGLKAGAEVIPLFKKA